MGVGVSIKNKKKFCEAAKNNVNAMLEQKLALIRTAAFAAYRDIIVESPVDTGRFRSNWMISVGNPDHSTRQTTGYEKGQAIDSAETARANQALAELGASELQATLWISNSLPYAQRLENAHSQQNKHFVARAKRNLAMRLKAIDNIFVEEGQR